MSKRTAVYFIQETVKDNQGYIPCIAVLGEKGYYRTNWNWGNDIDTAQQIAREKNSSLGYSSDDVQSVIMLTM